MSYALDVNVLLYASDTSNPRHAEARVFLEGCLARRELVYLAWMTVMSYLRIATHPSIFAAPLSHGDASRNIASLLEQPQVRVLSEAEGFWDTYSEIAGDVALHGNLVPDAHLAAILKQHGIVTLYSRDADFRRFSFLEVRNPFP